MTDLQKIESLISHYGGNLDYATDDSNDQAIVDAVNAATKTYNPGKRVLPDDVYSAFDLQTGAMIAATLDAAGQPSANDDATTAATKSLIRAGLSTFGNRGLLFTNVQTAAMFQQVATAANWPAEWMETITALGEHIAKPVLKELGRELTLEDIANQRAKRALDIKLGQFDDAYAAKRDAIRTAIDNGTQDGAEIDALVEALA